MRCPAGMAEGVTTSSPLICKEPPFQVGGLDGGIAPQHTLSAIPMPFASSSGQRLT